VWFRLDGFLQRSESPADLERQIQRVLEAVGLVLASVRVMAAYETGTSTPGEKAEDVDWAAVPAEI
jgi:hypothetical protein